MLRASGARVRVARDVDTLFAVYATCWQILRHYHFAARIDVLYASYVDIYVYRHIVIVGKIHYASHATPTLCAIRYAIMIVRCRYHAVAAASRYAADCFATIDDACRRCRL